MIERNGRPCRECWHYSTVCAVLLGTQIADWDRCYWPRPKEGDELALQWVPDDSEGSALLVAALRKRKRP